MITWPSDTKEITDQIRTAIGRNITFHTHANSTDCPTCLLDPLSGKSTDPFCPTCGGTGYITVETDTEVLAHINWNSIGDQILTPGGHIFDGDCRLSIEYTLANMVLVTTADYILVDTKKTYMKNYDIRGFKTPNRIIISVVEDPRDI